MLLQFSSRLLTSVQSLARMEMPGLKLEKLMYHFFFNLTLSVAIFGFKTAL